MPRKDGIREDITQIMWPSALHPPLRELPLHRKALAVARELIGADAELDFDMMIHKDPHTAVPTPWHQDAAYWIDMPDHRAVSIRVALDDAEVDNGCMWYVRGSHEQPLRPHRPTSDGKNIECDCSEDEPGATPVPLRAGEAVAHPGFTLHYSRGNTTDGTRRAYILNYRPAAMIRHERARGADHGLHENVRQVRNSGAVEDRPPGTTPPPPGRPPPARPQQPDGKAVNAVILTGAVMTHPRRRAAIAAKDPLGRVRVVTDPDPSGPPTALRTANPSWSCVGADATHHVVFQDDVLIAENFFPCAEKAAAAVPDEAIAFYEGWEGRNSGVVRLGALRGAQWAYAIDEHVPSLALMLPADVARGYERFAAEHGNGWPYDVVIQRYLKALDVPVRIAVPSTVDHDDVPSIAGNSTHGWRRATFFTDRAAFSLDENSACPTFSLMPFYQYGESKCAVRRGDRWEYLDTDRYLRRVGLLGRCEDGFAAADRPDLPGAVCRQVWLTAFATGVALAALLARPAGPEVCNVASAGYDETAFAELVTQTARRTPWERADTPAPHTPLMSTALITAETGWRPAAPVHNAARAQAQWLACDTHDDLVGLWRAPDPGDGTGVRRA